MNTQGFRYNQHSRRGQSLVEILIAIAIGIIMIIGAVTVVAPSIRTQGNTVHVQTAAAFGKGLLDNVRVFAESNWSTLARLSTSSAFHYYLNATSSPFTTSTGDQVLTVGTTTYTRYFYVDEAKRDASGYLVTSGGTLDPSTRKISVAYSWTSGVTTTMVTYLTRSRSLTFSQSDWSGGGGQDGPITAPTNTFSTSTGSINATSSPGSIVLSISGVAASGTVTSSIIDSGQTNGCALNSILWQGSLPGGAVKFQLAVASSTSGPWNSLGPNCTTNPADVYAPTPGSSTSVTASCTTGYRYFRYKAVLESNLAGTLAPRVDDITINWSP